MTITLMLIGMIGLSLLNVPIAIALGFVAMAAIAPDPGAGHAAEPGAGNVQRRFQLPAAGDSAVHPVGRHHERLVDLAAADRIRVVAGRIRARRPVDGVDRHLGVLRRDFRLRRRRRGRARHDPDPGDEEPRLFQGGRRGDHVLGGEPRHHHPAVDPDDPLRGDGADLDGQAVRRRHRSRPPGRGWRWPAPPITTQSNTISRSRSVSVSPTSGERARKRCGPSSCRSPFWAASSAASSPRPKAPAWRCSRRSSSAV